MASFTFEEAMQAPKAPPAAAKSFTFEEAFQVPGGKKGFGARVQDAYASRMKKNEEIAENYVSGKDSYPEALMQFGAQGAMLSGDIFAEGLKSAGKGISYLTPDVIEEPIRRGLSAGIDYAVDSPVGRAAGAAADYAVQKYRSLAQKYPRAARDVEAAGALGLSFAPFVRVGGKSAASAAESLAEKGIKKSAEAAKSATSALVPSIPEGAAEIAQLAQKYKIPVSLSQVSDSRALSNIQKISRELPFSGSEAFRDKQLLAWQRQLFRTAGMEADRFTPSTMDAAFKKVGGEFDSLTKGKQFQIADELPQNLIQKQDEVLSAYGADAASAFEREALKVFNDFSPDGSISGDKLAFHRARINSLARKAKGANKEALQDLESVIIDGITSRDPELARTLSSAKQKYKNLIVLEPLARKAKKGFVSPALLNNRVSKVYGRAHTTGKSGEIGDLARIGHELLGEVGGSDTAQKLLYMTGAAGGLAVNAPLTAALVGGNRIVQGAALRNQALIRAAAKKAKLKEAMKLSPKEAQEALEKTRRAKP